MSNTTTTPMTTAAAAFPIGTQVTSTFRGEPITGTVTGHWGGGKRGSGYEGGPAVTLEDGREVYVLTENTAVVAKPTPALRATTFAATETNGHEQTLTAWSARIDAAHAAGRYDLSDTRVVRITRLRLLGDFDMGEWSVSYCFGELADGTEVRVDLPYGQMFGIRRSGGQLVVDGRELVKLAKAANRFGKQIGLYVGSPAISTMY